jgi:hypothetical protein
VESIVPAFGQLCLFLFVFTSVQTLGKDIPQGPVMPEASIVFGSRVLWLEKDCDQTGPRLQKTGPVVLSFNF